MKQNPAVMLECVNLIKPSPSAHEGKSLHENQFKRTNQQPLNRLDAKRKTSDKSCIATQVKLLLQGGIKSQTPAF